MSVKLSNSQVDTFIWEKLVKTASDLGIEVWHRPPMLDNEYHARCTKEDWRSVCDLMASSGNGYVTYRLTFCWTIP